MVMTRPWDRLRGRFEHLARADRGATAAEYSLIAALIAVVIVVSVAAFGQAVLGLFTSFNATSVFG
jgi:Flp pilus assembly pilin Flp